MSTVRELLQAISVQLGDDKWNNMGDVNYVEHGGVQVKYDSDHTEIHVVELRDYFPSLNSAQGIDGVMTLTEQWVDLADIFDTTDIFIEGDTGLDTLEFTGDAYDIARQYGMPLEEYMDDIQVLLLDDPETGVTELAQLFIDVVRGWVSAFGGSDYPEVWKLKDYLHEGCEGDGLYEQLECAKAQLYKEVEALLLGREFDIEPEFTLDEYSQTCSSLDVQTCGTRPE